MNLRGVVSVGVFMVLLAVAAMGATCPYTGDTTPTEYSSVSILPVEKYVGRAFTISINDVYKDGNRVEPAKSRSIYIYFIVDSEVASEYVLRTNDQGKATFTPDDSGKYAVATSSRYIFFDVLAKCGDGLCTSGEDRISCPEDCARCGDGICDVGETKQNCPKDCVICGDGICDVGENRETCTEDCATCGDGVCDTASYAGTGYATRKRYLGCTRLVVHKTVPCVGTIIATKARKTHLQSYTAPMTAPCAGTGYAQVPRLQRAAQRIV